MRGPGSPGPRESAPARWARSVGPDFVASDALAARTGAFVLWRAWPGIPDRCHKPPAVWVLMG